MTPNVCAECARNKQKPITKPLTMYEGLICFKRLKKMIPSTANAMRKRNAMSRLGCIVPVVLLDTTSVLPHIMATSSNANRAHNFVLPPNPIMSISISIYTTRASYKRHAEKNSAKIATPFRTMPPPLLFNKKGVGANPRLYFVRLDDACAYSLRMCLSFSTAYEPPQALVSNLQ